MRLRHQTVRHAVDKLEHHRLLLSPVRFGERRLKPPHVALQVFRDVFRGLRGVSAEVALQVREEALRLPQQGIEQVHAPPLFQPLPLRGALLVLEELETHWSQGLVVVHREGLNLRAWQLLLQIVGHLEALEVVHHKGELVRRRHILLRVLLHRRRFFALGPFLRPASAAVVIAALLAAPAEPPQLRLQLPLPALVAAPAVRVAPCLMVCPEHLGSTVGAVGGGSGDQANLILRVGVLVPGFFILNVIEAPSPEVHDFAPHPRVVISSTFLHLHLVVLVEDRSPHVVQAHQPPALLFRHLHHAAEASQPILAFHLHAHARPDGGLGDAA
mmetsp:Transcript_108384/g.258640  ORF Transcript_108384/g.258640 Transcript_108384/m.258640 type:complete len:329 (+) Transcript_108384:1083-2069(+)